jgi:hypothetical protein
MIVHLIPIAVPLAVGLGLLAGIAVGLIHFTQLRRSVRLLAAGRLGLAFATQALRVLLSAMLLAALAWLGFGALLAGLAGFLLSRQWLLRRERVAAAAETQP